MNTSDHVHYRTDNVFESHERNKRIYGDTFVTLIDSHIKETVELFRHANIWVVNGNQLHTTLTDLSDFWEFDRSRK